MNRRAFIAGFASTAAWPLVARGQPGGQGLPHRLGSSSAPISDLAENSSSQAYRAFVGE